MMTMFSRGPIGVLLLVVGIQLVALAQEAPRRPEAQLAIEKALRDRLAQPIEGPLDVDLITLGEEFCGTAPSGMRFSLDERSLIFEWRRWNEKDEGTFLYDIETRELRRLDEGEDAPLSDRDVIFSRDRRFALASRNDRLTLIELPAAMERVLMPLLGGGRAQSFADGHESIVLREGDDLFAWTIDSGALRRLTRIEKEKKEAKKDEREAYLEEAERRLIRHLFEEKEEREKAEARREKKRELEAWAPPEGFKVSRLEASDDLRRVLVLLHKSGQETATTMPRYLSADGYVTTFSSRPKVGDESDESRMALLDATTGKEIAVELEPLVGKGPVSIRSAGFAPDSSRLVVLFRQQDNKKAMLVEISRDGKARLLHEVEDEAWVRHVGDDTGYLDDGRFWFTSEKPGFNHLYVEKESGGEIEQITQGDWLVDEVIERPAVVGAPGSPRSGVDGFPGSLALRTTRSSPHERHHELPQGVSLLHGLPGDWCEAFLSPSGHLLAYLRSSANEPPRLVLRAFAMPAPTDSIEAPGPPYFRETWITDSPSPAFKSRRWIEPEFIQFEASDGVRVPARLYKPSSLQPGAPAVIFVHGAGYLQNVIRGWSPYYREYMFHNLLVERGYVVIDVDYRGSAGYGRDWRTAIYRNMGGRDLEDQVDAASFMVKELGVDPGRIGIYGGSYGGFITLMALFKHPGLFAAGAALRPVTDWAHYNHGYTSNILNTPQKDAEAFERSSPIWFADGLADRLLICHGLEDDNVQPQDSIRLVQRLIELRKTGWELAVYPVEPHGFRDPSSWADEYKRILQLFDSSIGKER